MKTIKTRDQEVYEKLNMLKHFNEVLIDSSKMGNLARIATLMNKEQKIIEFKKVGDYIVVKKINPFLYNIYHR